MCILDTENKSEDKLRNMYEEKSCLNKLANKKAHTKKPLTIPLEISLSTIHRKVVVFLSAVKATDHLKFPTSLQGLPHQILMKFELKFPWAGAVFPNCLAVIANILMQT